MSVAARRCVGSVVVALALFDLRVNAQVVVPDGNGGFPVPGRAPGSPDVFVPLRGMPDHVTPPTIGNDFYVPRMTGIFGFVDPTAYHGQGFDREYYLGGRGDGLFLIEGVSLDSGKSRGPREGVPHGAPAP